MDGSVGRISVVAQSVPTTVTDRSHSGWCGMTMNDGARCLGTPP